MTNEDKKIDRNVLDDDIYATKKELNDEARIRADNDMKIIDDFTMLRKTSNNKFAELTDKITEIDQGPILEKVNKLEESQNQNQAAINKLLADQAALSDSVDIVKSSIDEVVISVSSIKENQKALSDKVDATKSSVDGMVGSISKIEEEQTALSNKVDANQAAVTESLAQVSDKVDANKSAIDGLIEGQAVLSDKIDATKASVDGMAGSISKIEESQAALNEGLTQVSDKVDTNTETVQGMADSIVKIEEEQTALSNKVDANKSEIDGFEEEMTTVKANVKSNQDRIDNLETNFLERIKKLEEEYEKLTSELSEANKTIDEKNSVIDEKKNEIEKLQEEIQANNDGNKINLRFANPLEFEITEVISVKNFINTYLKELVISRMNLRYPETEWGKDYSISLNGLDYNDVMQGKNLTATVFAIQDGKLADESNFEIIVNHNYNINQKVNFIEEFLQTAIPVSLRDVPENASPDYNIPDEIVKTKPLKLLLHSKEFKSLPLKIFAEMNAASYWTNFHRSWQYIRNGYVGTGQSTIGSGAIINNVRDLYNSNLGYYNNIFKLIEQRINDSGVPCTITKKWVKQSRSGETLHTLGNLTFDVTNINLDTDEVSVIQSRHYYLMINFEVDLNDGLKKFCRGVTLVLSDNLELY